MRFILFALVCFCSVSTPARAGDIQDIRPPQSIALNDTDYANTYILSAGDHINVDVYGDENLSKRYTLDTAGLITMPLIGAVEAEGLNTSQLSIILYERLSDGYFVDPDITVTIPAYKPVFIMGEVHAPGEYAFKPGITVLNAVATAGGFTYRANKKMVKIMRHHSDSDAQSTLKLPMTTLLQSGDTVIVAERFF